MGYTRACTAKGCIPRGRITRGCFNRIIMGFTKGCPIAAAPLVMQPLCAWDPMHLHTIVLVEVRAIVVSCSSIGVVQPSCLARGLRVVAESFID
jgi:hypothetical protein